MKDIILFVLGFFIMYDMMIVIFGRDMNLITLLIEPVFYFLFFIAVLFVAKMFRR